MRKGPVLPPGEPLYFVLVYLHLRWDFELASPLLKVFWLSLVLLFTVNELEVISRLS